ncbi:MAG: hypothetical protein WDM86_18635 [Rhizomicrobium sp.]
MLTETVEAERYAAVGGGRRRRPRRLPRPGLADALEIFTAPMALGGGGHDGIGALAAATMGAAPRFTLESVRKIGADLLESYRARA